MARAVPIGFLTVGGLLAGCEKTFTDDDIVDIRQAELRTLTLKTAKDPRALLLIDSRSEGDYAVEHIAGAMNLQLYDLNPDRPRIKRFDSYGDLVVYGADPGSATAKALTKRLMEQDYAPVRRYRGGLAEWKASGFPTESSEAKAASTPAPK